MSSNFYFHPCFQETDRLSLVLQIVESLEGRFKIDELVLHPPTELFRAPKTFRYPKVYSVSLVKGLIVDYEILGCVSTDLIHKNEAQGEQTIEIDQNRMAAYIRDWSPYFSIWLAVSHKDDARFIANLEICVNTSSAFPESSSWKSEVVVMGPSIVRREDDLLWFIDVIRHLFEIDGFEFGTISREVTPRPNADEVIVAKIGAPQLALVDVTRMHVLDEIATRSGLVKVFVSHI